MWSDKLPLQCVASLQFWKAALFSPPPQKFHQKWGKSWLGETSNLSVLHFLELFLSDDFSNKWGPSHPTNYHCSTLQVSNPVKLHFSEMSQIVIKTAWQTHCTKLWPMKNVQQLGKYSFLLSEEEKHHLPQHYLFLLCRLPSRWDVLRGRGEVEKFGNWGKQSCLTRLHFLQVWGFVLSKSQNNVLWASLYNFA